METLITKAYLGTRMLILAAAAWGLTTTTMVANEILNEARLFNSFNGFIANGF